jgi:cytochrome oxidase Cu insertion factor (SCO1/SenC/PrrC family)
MKKTRARRAAAIRRPAGPLMYSAGLTLFLLMLLLGAVACGSSGAESATETTQTSQATQTTGAGGAQAPDFSGVTLAGDEVSLSEYRGKPLVLAFMASW